MYTQEDLDRIRACIASGVLETRFADGRSVRYQSLKDMMDAERRIADAVNASSGTAAPRRQTPAYRNGC